MGTKVVIQNALKKEEFDFSQLNSGDYIFAKDKGHEMIILLIDDGSFVDITNGSIVDFDWAEDTLDNVKLLSHVKISYE